MAEHQGTLYTVSVDEALASADGGETWNALGPRPKGIASGLIVTAATQKGDPKASITLSLALQEKGIFRSTNAGKHWTPLNDGLAGETDLYSRYNRKYPICWHKPRALSLRFKPLATIAPPHIRCCLRFDSRQKQPLCWNGT